MSQPRNTTRRATGARKLPSSTLTTTTTKQPSQPSSVKVPRQFVSQVCGLTDPFCTHANGAKYPDFSSVKTLPYTRRLRSTLTSDANGYANLLIMPQYASLPYNNNSANVYAGNTVTTWANFLPATVIAGVSGYRIVSAGFVVRHIVSPLNSAGMVYIRQYGQQDGAYISPLDTSTYNATSVCNVPVQEAREIAVILQKTAQMPQTMYSPLTDTGLVANTATRGVGYATVAIAGAPASTPILEIEYVINFELVFEDGSDLAQVATPPPPANSMITDAAARVSSTLTPIVADGLSAAGRMFVTKATTALAGYLGGPPASMLARTALAITVD